MRKLRLRTLTALLCFACILPLHAADSDRFVFPLKASRDNRYFVDQNGKPFLYQADTAWMIFSQLTVGEAEEYLVARKAQGFTAIQTMLAMTPETRNRNGEAPFYGENDFARPNEKYFAHVDSVLAAAEKENLAIAIAALWVGCCREGWAGRTKTGELKPMNVNGPEKCRAFGRWIGKRFEKYPNLLWIMGGDNDPAETREEILSLALGIKEAAPRQMITYHAASTHSSTDVWPSEGWLDFSMVYTYFRGFNKAWNKTQPDVYEVGYAELNKPGLRMPFILGESTYEGEHGDWGSALQVRKQAYWTMLSGGAGHAYGSPNWRLRADWRKVLQLPGAGSLHHLRTLFERRPWYRLIPDQKGEFAIAGAGAYGQNDYATTAMAADRTFAITYIPSGRRITYDLSRFGDGRIQASWFNPRTGAVTAAGTHPTNATRMFEPPEDGDWVLVFDRSGSGLPDLATAAF